MDYVKGKHRGFAFVEYQDAEDADEAIFNMDGAELAGKVISVSVAQPNQVNRLLMSTLNDGSGAPSNEKNASLEAVWTSDEWFQKQVGGLNKEDLTNQHNREADAKTLQET